MQENLYDQIEAILHRHPVQISALHGGMIGEVHRVELADGEAVVAKTGRDDGGQLDIEGYMLRYLAENSRLPVPEVLHSSPALLIMTFMPGSSTLGPSVQSHAAELLADLHSIRSDQFGLDRDTLIGSLHQPNPWTDTWLDFFRDHRLLHMAHAAHDEGRIDARLLSRLVALGDHLDQWIEEPPHPSLLHGDVWTTNVLAADGRVTGFVDPAIYYGHPEIELAFTTLFGTFGPAFFERYHAIRPISPGFMEERRDLYNLYPLLVHVRLFGGGYAASVDATLRRFGY
jgi:fructosamine-3-kinase